MPAFVNSRLGAVGMSEDDGTMVCCFDWKKSRNDWRIWAEVIGRWNPEGRFRNGSAKIASRSGERRFWPAMVSTIAREIWSGTPLHSHGGTKFGTGRDRP